MVVQKCLNCYEKDLDISTSLFQRSKTIWVLCLQFCCWKGLKPPIHFGLLGNQETHVNCKMTNSDHFKFKKVELILPFKINKLLPERSRLLSFLSSEKMFSSNMPFILDHIVQINLLLTLEIVQSTCFHLIQETLNLKRHFRS